MNLKIDENVPIEATEELRRAGHDALTVVDQLLAGQPDSRIAAVCQAESRAVVTLDLDFSDIRTFPPRDYAGIIVLRPSVQTIQSVVRLVKQAITLLKSESPTGNLWIVDESQIRIRAGNQQSP